MGQILWGNEDMKKYASAVIMLVVLCSLAVTGRARIMDKQDLLGLPTIAPSEFQPHPRQCYR